MSLSCPCPPACCSSAWGVPPCLPVSLLSCVPFECVPCWLVTPAARGPFPVVSARTSCIIASILCMYGAEGWA
jgi:hypothetical protein